MRVASCAGVSMIGAMASSPQIGITLFLASICLSLFFDLSAFALFARARPPEGFVGLGLFLSLPVGFTLIICGWNLIGTMWFSSSAFPDRQLVKHVRRSAASAGAICCFVLLSIAQLCNLGINLIGSSGNPNAVNVNLFFCFACCI
jgi:hypothetical protein